MRAVTSITVKPSVAHTVTFGEEKIFPWAHTVTSMRVVTTAEPSVDVVEAKPVDSVIWNAGRYLTTSPAQSIILDRESFENDEAFDAAYLHFGSMGEIISYTTDNGATHSAFDELVDRAASYLGLTNTASLLDVESITVKWFMSPLDDDESEREELRTHTVGTTDEEFITFCRTVDFELCLMAPTELVDVTMTR